MKSSFKSLLLLLPLLCLTQFNSAQPLPVRWAKFFPTNWEANNFSAEKIIEITNGGIVVVGTRRFESQTLPHDEVMVLRIDTDGNQIWQKNFGGLYYRYVENQETHEIDTIITPWEQEVHDMVQTPEGNFLITGFRDYTANFPDTPNGLLLIEISPSGTVLFESVFYHQGLDECEGYSIAHSIDGGYVIAATLNPESSGTDDRMMLMRLEKDTEGNYHNNEFPLSVNTLLGVKTRPGWIRPLNNGYLVAGTSYYVDAKSEIYLQRTYEDRTEWWTKYFGGAGDDEFCDAVIYAEHIYLAGSSKVPMGLPVNDVQSLLYQVYVAKLDFEGNTVWSRTYGGLSTNYGMAIDVIDNNLMIAVNHITPQVHSEMALLNVDAETGDSLWMQTYGSFYSAGISDGARTSDFGYLVAGRASYTGTQDPRIYVMKFNNSSNTVGETLVRTDLNLSVATDNPTKDVINVTADKNTIYGVTVVIDSLLHPSVGDLEIRLEHDGTEVTLIDRPIHSGENFIHTGLVDVEETSIQSGYAPYTDWFRPDHLLQPFLEHDPSGEWTLTITDHGTGGMKATGRVLAGWSLNLLTESSGGTGVHTEEALDNFGLESVRPNPFSQEAIVEFRIAEAGSVRVAVFNQLGQLVKVIVDEELSEGVYERLWHPEGLAAGTYLIHLETPGMVSVRKAVLTR